VNLAGLLALEGEGTMIHQSIISCSPSDTVKAQKTWIFENIAVRTLNRSLNNYVTIHTVQTFTSSYFSEMERVMMKMMMKIVMVLMGTVVISQV
jgi:hypothetical protein